MLEKHVITKYREHLVDPRISFFVVNDGYKNVFLLFVIETMVVLQILICHLVKQVIQNHSLPCYLREHGVLSM